MLTPWDEQLCHQLPTTLDHPATSDPDWTERIYLSIYDVVDHEVIIGCGFGQYPNRNVQDGFVCVWHAGKQHNIRVSRALRPTPHEIKVGPLRCEVREGLRRLRFVLEPNDSDIAMDIEWTGTMNPHEEEPDFRRSKGRVVQHINRFDQVGRASGWLEVGSRRFDMTAERFWTHRDRSWGQRRPLRTDPSIGTTTRFAPFLFSWSAAQFDDFAFHWRFVHREGERYSYISGEKAVPVGTEPLEGRHLVSTTQNYRWDGSGSIQTLLGGEITLHWADGTSDDVSFETLPPRWHLKGGGYGGYRGFLHGTPKGPLHVEHDVWDLGDPAVLAEASTLSDHLIRFESGGKVGWGIMEYGVGAGYGSYSEVQHLPTF